MAKHRLQYVYTITVFLGVLLTAYLMMSQEGRVKSPVRSVYQNYLPTEASVVDSGVNELLKMNEELSRLPARDNTKEHPKKSNDRIHHAEKP